MKPHTLNYINPTPDEMNCAISAINGRCNFTIKRFSMHSNNTDNMKTSFYIKGAVADINKPIELNSKTSILFTIQPFSNVTIILYPSITFWQWIKNLLAI